MERFVQELIDRLGGQGFEKMSWGVDSTLEAQAAKELTILSDALEALADSMNEAVRNIEAMELWIAELNKELLEAKAKQESAEARAEDIEGLYENVCEERNVAVAGHSYVLGRLAEVRRALEDHPRGSIT